MSVYLRCQSKKPNEDNSKKGVCEVELAECVTGENRREQREPGKERECK